MSLSKQAVSTRQREVHFGFTHKRDTVRLALGMVSPTPVQRTHFKESFLSLLSRCVLDCKTVQKCKSPTFHIHFIISSCI